MSLKLKNQYCDKAKLINILEEMVSAMQRDYPEPGNLVFIGILEGGSKIVDYLARRLGELNDRIFPVAYLDITLYRDDVIDTMEDPYHRATEIPFAVKGKEIILVDDVLFTGRTARAALSAILANGRPKQVKLAAVVDRGFRELPIHADYVGTTLKTAINQGVRVRTDDSHGEPGIYIYEEESQNSS